MEGICSAVAGCGQCLIVDDTLCTDGFALLNALAARILRGGGGGDCSSVSWLTAGGSQRLKSSLRKSGVSAAELARLDPVDADASLLQRVAGSYAHARASDPPDGPPRRHIVILDDVAMLVDCFPSLRSAANVLTGLHRWAQQQQSPPVRLLLRGSTACDWGLQGSPCRASLSFLGLLRARSDCVISLAPLPSGFSRDVHGRVVVCRRPTTGPGAFGVAGAAGGGLYRVADAGIEFLGCGGGGGP